MGTQQVHREPRAQQSALFLPRRHLVQVSFLGCFLEGQAEPSFSEGLLTPLPSLRTPDLLRNCVLSHRKRSWRSTSPCT